MSDLDRTITYVFRMVDNTSETANQISQSTDQAKGKVDNLNQSESQLNVQASQTTATLQAQQVNLMTSLTAIMGLRSAVSGVTQGLIGLGIVSGESAEQLMKINKAFQLFTGAATAIKAVSALMSTLNMSTLTYASISTYLAALKNPFAIGAIAAGVGVAAGVGAYFLTNKNTTNNNTSTINIVDTAPARQVADNVVYISGALK